MFDVWGQDRCVLGFARVNADVAAGTMGPVHHSTVCIYIPHGSRVERRCADGQQSFPALNSQGLQLSSRTLHGHVAAVVLLITRYVRGVMLQDATSPSHSPLT